MMPAKKKSKTKTKEAKAPEITIRGTIQRILWSNGNNFCLLLVKSPGIQSELPEGHDNLSDLCDTPDEIKVIAFVDKIRVNDEYNFAGAWEKHSKHGWGFKSSSFELLMPSGKAGVARYLSNITFGVGLAKATKIVEKLGEDCLEKLKTDPSLIEKLDFLNQAQQQEIAEDLGKNSVQAELAGMIVSQGIGMSTVSKIMRQYGSEAVKVVKENPYILSKDLYGVGFLKADAVAQRVGISPKSPFRVEAALDYTLNEAGSEGHVFLQPNDIVRKLIGKKGLIEASGVEIGDVARANKKLIDEGACVREGDAVYSKDLWEAEIEVAGSVKRLLAGEKRRIAGLDNMIEDVQSQKGLEFSDQQKEAISIALTENLSILTGGPGTGKSFTVLGITEIYKRVNPYNQIYLAAPTGRAAKRMKEATGEDAKTIHRLLRYLPDTQDFYHGSLNPLPGPGILIVDEVSMLDIELASDLLSATEELQVVLVGDVDQLPSVGPGSVLRDLIASGKVPTTRLKFNYRQAGGSKIAEYANLICQGEMPPLMNAGDFEYIAVENGDQAAEVVRNLVHSATMDGLGKMDFQVLAPMRRGSCGVTALNEAVREIVNPDDGRQAKLGDYRLGDKVMVIHNDYKLGVFNGDIGIISGINKGILTVDFAEDGFVEFSVEDLGLLTLSYASTIHKSQGSEFPLVIMPLTHQSFIMLQRNLLYTGMTRAKRRLVLVAEERSVKRAVNNNVIEKRHSKLAERIRET